MEKKVVDHLWHEHPLIVSENESSVCYGCGQPVSNSETAYVCMEQECRNKIILYKKCGELPSQISHPKHPQHPICLVDFRLIVNHWCNLCCRDIGEVLGYRCDSCDFDIDITCEKLSIDTFFREKLLPHPSHPDHPLTLMRKPALFHCDGCGTKDVDMAYICTTCELWFHESCVMLPPILPLNLQLHHHQLSLVFSIPEKYKPGKYITTCDICDKKFDMTCWVYFCGDCRFFAHIKCATSTQREPHLKQKTDDNDVIQFPLHVDNVCKELITPFVMRENGLDKIPDADDMPRIVRMPETTATYSFLFNYHKHPLSLVSDEEVEEDEDEEEDKDEECEERLKICDVCVTPISSPPYYECAPCRYFVHSICYFLPQTLSSSFESPHLYGDRCPQTHDNHHKFKLSGKLWDIDPWSNECKLCWLPTTGRVYECEGCSDMIDVKCACLPNKIRYASHSHHKPLIMTTLSTEERRICNICLYGLAGWKFAYCCNSDGCDFALHIKCVMLPSSIRNNEWDKHPLLLLFDASLDHPSDFFCGFCEEEMHPKKAMYHCRQCDNSSHLFCYTSASGWCRNIKFGRQFVLDGIHPHPLTFNWITLQKRCHICRCGVYDNIGLECAPCYYALCLSCTMKYLLRFLL